MKLIPTASYTALMTGRSPLERSFVTSNRPTNLRVEETGHQYFVTDFPRLESQALQDGTFVRQSVLSRGPSSLEGQHSAALARTCSGDVMNHRREGIDLRCNSCSRDIT